MKRFLYIIALLTITINSFGQLTIDGEIRPRFEYRDGYKTLPDSTNTMAAFVSQRSRINIAYTTDNLSTYISFQDYRVWGEDKLKADVAGIALSQAWADYSISKTFALKVGRQIIKYDNQRLMSAANWNQVGSSHDAVMLKYKKNDWNIDFSTAYNQTAQNTYGTDYSANIKNYKSLNVLWISKKIGNITLSNLNIADSYQKIGTTNTNYLRYTSGLIANLKKDNLNLTGRGFYQFGEDQKGTEIAAYYYNAEGTYKLSDALSVNAGVEYKSGNDYTDTTNTQNNAFDILYGSRHKFNGKIDYFSIPSTSKNAGLADYYLGLSYKVNEKVSLKADWHYFMLGNNFVANGETIDYNLGNEIDLSATIKFSKVTSLMIGYSMMFATESMETIKGSGDSGEFCNYAFVMLTIKPKFFNSNDYQLKK